MLDGVGHEFLCKAAEVSRETVTLRVTQKNSIPPLPCQITLLQAVPRGKIIESIIQKAVELGAHRIVPLLTERVVTRLERKGKTSKQENGNWSPSRPSNNAARPGCQKLKRR